MNDLLPFALGFCIAFLICRGYRMIASTLLNKAAEYAKEAQEKHEGCTSKWNQMAVVFKTDGPTLAKAIDHVEKQQEEGWKPTPEATSQEEVQCPTCGMILHVDDKDHSAKQCKEAKRCRQIREEMDNFYSNQDRLMHKAIEEQANAWREEGHPCDAEGDTSEHDEVSTKGDTSDV